MKKKSFLSDVYDHRHCISLSQMVTVFTHGSSSNCNLQNAVFFSNKQDYILRKQEIVFIFVLCLFLCRTIYEDTHPFLPSEWSVWRLSKVIRIDLGSDINETFFSRALIWDLHCRCWTLKCEFQNCKDVLKLSQAGRIFAADAYGVVIVEYFNWLDIIQVRSDRKTVPLQRGMQTWSYC